MSSTMAAMTRAAMAIVRVFTFVLLLVPMGPGT